MNRWLPSTGRRGVVPGFPSSPTRPSQNEFFRVERLKYERPFPETSAMRLSRFRFTVRRVMVAVAVLGLLFGAEVTRRRWKHNLLMANYHADEERRMRLLLSGGWITETDEAGKRKNSTIRERAKTPAFPDNAVPVRPIVRAVASWSGPSS
jgi:ribosomal protein L28